MVAIVKELKRNSEGQQWVDTEVFFEEKDAVSYMNEKVEHLIAEGFTLKISEKNHRYVADEEEGSEVEFIIDQKMIRGKSTKPLLYEDLPFSMNQVIPNGWETEWIDTGAGEWVFAIFKRFISKNGNPYFIHMNFKSMKMVYVIDETRTYNEDRGSFEVGAIWEPNEIVLLQEDSRNQEAFEQNRHLISKEDEEQIVECYERARTLWNMIQSDR